MERERPSRERCDVPLSGKSSEEDYKSRMGQCLLDKLLSRGEKSQRWLCSAWGRPQDPERGGREAALFAYELKS